VNSVTFQDIDGRAGRLLGKTEGAAGVVPVAVLAEDLVEQVDAPVDHQVLLVELQVRIDTSQEHQHPRAVERPMGVPDGVEDFGGAVAHRRLPLVDRQAGAELAL
jgi:hypothetical protein